MIQLIGFGEAEIIEKDAHISAGLHAAGGVTVQQDLQCVLFRGCCLNTVEYKKSRGLITKTSAKKGAIFIFSLYAYSIGQVLLRVSIFLMKIK